MEHLPPAWIDRFVEEARITAQLDHPGIVPVHELGVDPHGRLFFTMKLVRGRNLAAIFELTRAQAEDWNLTRAVRALLQACQAVAYAHEHGVIHRDLKPENIMVGRLGEVFVMDWGICRSATRKDIHEIRPLPTPHPQATSDPHTGAAPPPTTPLRPEPSPLVTRDGTVLGTPAYMSPEHALGKVEEIGPWSDVFSLGAVIYQLLSGHPPHAAPGQGRTTKELLDAVGAGPPDDIDRLAHSQPVELVAICAKAMDRDRTRRYPDAGALAEDLQAWLDHRVVRAHRTGALAELRAWIGRNRLAALSQAAAVILAMAGLLTIIVLQDRARREATGSRRALEANNQELRLALHRAGITRAAEALERGETDAARAAIDGCEPSLRTWEWYHLRARLPHRLQIAAPGEGSEMRAALSPDGRWIVGIDWDRRLLVWNARDGRLRSPPLPLEDPPYSLALDPTGPWAAIGGTNGTLVLRSWQDTTLRWSTMAHSGRVSALDFSPDGSRLISGGMDATVSLWATDSGRRLATTHIGGRVLALKFSPDATQVIAANGVAGAQLLDAGSLVHIRTLGDSNSAHNTAAFSPDGTRIATAGKTGTVQFWDADSGQPLPSAPPNADDRAAFALAWSPDGQRLAAGGSANIIQLRESSRGQVTRTLRSQGWGWLPALEFSRDSRWLLASGTKGGIGVRLWEIDVGQAITLIRGASDRLWSAAFTGDGRSLVMAAFDGSLTLADAIEGRVLRTLRGHTHRILWSVVTTPDGRHAVSGGQDGTVRVWDLSTGALKTTIQAQPFPDRDGDAPLFAAVSPDGSRVVSGGVDGNVQVWNLQSGARIWSGGQSPGRLWCVAWSPDGRQLATAGDQGRLTLWDGDLGTKLWQTNRGIGTVVSVAFQTDGRRMLTAQQPRSLTFWDPADGRVLRDKAIQESHLATAAVSPDGRLVASAGHDRTVRLHDAETLDPVLDLPREPNMITFVTFSPDGRRLVSCSADGQARVWQTETAPKSDRTPAP